MQIMLWHFVDYNYVATEPNPRLTATQHDCAVYCLNMHPTKAPVHKFQPCFTNCAELTVEYSRHIWHEYPACSIDENDGTSCSRNIHLFVMVVLFASWTFAPIYRTLLAAHICRVHQMKSSQRRHINHTLSDKPGDSEDRNGLLCPTGHQ